MTNSSDISHIAPRDKAEILSQALPYIHLLATRWLGQAPTQRRPR